MKERLSFFSSLSEADRDKIRLCAPKRQLGKNELVFAQGDIGDSFYIIEQGSVSIFFHDGDGQKKDICVLNDGDYFGEMGILNHDRRSASVIALEDSTFLCLDKDNFIALTNSSPELGEKINNIMTKRNEELILRESLCDAIGVRGENLYVSIKGDPSLRETALFRERYESPIDKVLEELQPKLKDLILNRCVFHLVVNFNSAEVRVRTIFDPFREYVHTADKLIDQAYLERHFIETGFEEKLGMIRETFLFISQTPLFDRLPAQWKNIFSKSREQWLPLSRDEVENVMSSLVELRNIPEFYLRNISINIVQDAIRMQFNCDGTHIVGAESYREFLAKNFEENY